MNLFENAIEDFLEIESVPIDDFKNKDNQNFDWLYNNTKRITIDSDVIFKPFYRINNISYTSMPEYNLSPFYSESTRNYRYRYCIIKDKDDYILVMFRIIDPINKKQMPRYFILAYNVLSYKGKKSDYVYEILSLNKDIKYKMVICDETDDWCSCNFYCDKEFHGKRSSNYRKQVKRVHRLFDDIIEVKSIKKYDNDLCDSIKFIVDEWCKEKTKITLKSHLSMARICFENNFPLIGFYINGKLCGIQMCSSDVDGTISIHTGKDISGLSLDFISKNYCNGNKEDASIIKRFLGLFIEDTMMNICLNDLGYDAIFVDGVMGNNTKGLFEHKLKCYGKVIYYKKIKM